VTAACGTHRRGQKTVQSFGGKPEGKSPLTRPRHRWEAGMMNPRVLAPRNYLIAYGSIDLLSLKHHKKQESTICTAATTRRTQGLAGYGSRTRSSVIQGTQTACHAQFTTDHIPHFTNIFTSYSSLFGYSNSLYVRKREMFSLQCLYHCCCTCIKFSLFAYSRVLSSDN
jgi:hypothetical protein